MGQSFSNFDEKSIKKFIENVFKEEQKSRLKRRDFMVVGDIINLELNDEHPVNFLHLGLLYCLDVDKDGRFCIDDMQTFAVEIMQKIA